MSRRSESDSDYEHCNCNKCVKKRKEKIYERNNQCYQRNQICNCYFCNRNNDNSNSHNNLISHNNSNKCIKKDECQKSKTIVITIN